MGSYVSTAKKVAAFRTAAGKIGYLMFEEGYSKNVHPHKPSWSCVGIGYLDEVVNLIFQMAAVCEGGSLQHSGGHVKPETYIERWFEELAAPVAMYNSGGLLKFEGSLSATLPNEKKGQIVAALQASGHADLIPEMETAGYTAKLYEDFDLLRAVYGNGEVGAWRFVGSVHGNQPVVAELGYASEPNGLPTVRMPRMYRFCGHTETLLVEQLDGTFRAEGWAYSVVGNFIASYGPVNLKYPGSFRKVFAAYRAQTQNAPLAPNEAVAKLELPIDDSVSAKWHRDDLAHVVARIPVEADRTFITMGELRAADLAHRGDNLLWKMERVGSLVWTIPNPDELDVGGGDAATGGGQTAQEPA